MKARTELEMSGTRPKGVQHTLSTALERDAASLILCSALLLTVGLKKTEERKERKDETKRGWWVAGFLRLARRRWLWRLAALARRCTIEFQKCVIRAPRIDVSVVVLKNFTSWQLMGDLWLGMRNADGF